MPPFLFVKQQQSIRRSRAYSRSRLDPIYQTSSGFWQGQMLGTCLPSRPLSQVTSRSRLINPIWFCSRTSGIGNQSNSYVTNDAICIQGQLTRLAKPTRLRTHLFTSSGSVKYVASTTSPAITSHFLKNKDENIKWKFWLSETYM